MSSSNIGAGRFANWLQGNRCCATVAALPSVAATALMAFLVDLVARAHAIHAGFELSVRPQTFLNHYLLVPFIQVPPPNPMAFVSLHFEQEWRLMANHPRRSGQLITASFTLVGSLAAAACGDDPIEPREEFPEELYSIGFEGPQIALGRFVGQDQWFAAFGDAAASVVSGDVRTPRDGSHSLQVDGSRLDEFQGFYFGSFARPLSYAPLRSGMERVMIEGWLGLVGSDGGTCGSAIGLTGILNGEPTANILIGIQEQDGAFVAYLSNFDGEAVFGPTYTVGDWMHLRAVLDFQRRTVEGFVNNVSIGEVPFTQGIGDEIAFMNISLGSSRPIPQITSYYDGMRVAAGREERR